MVEKGKSAKRTGEVELGRMEPQGFKSLKQSRHIGFSLINKGTPLVYMKNIPKFIFFLLLFLMISVVGNDRVLAEENLQKTVIQTKQDETNKNKYYSIVDELVCGEGRVITVTVREKASEHVSIVDQTIYLVQPQKDETVLVRGSSDWDTRKQENLILENRETIEYLAYSWDCIKDKNAKAYVVISYTSGGNCPSCEWEEVYDLQGKVVASTYIPYFKLLKNGRFDEIVAGNAGDNTMKTFNNILKTVGIEYSSQSLKVINYEN